MKYIIEHLEPELYEWCVIEYKHIAEIIGKDNLIITNLPASLHQNVSEFATPHKESVCALQLGNLCLLELDAAQELSSDDQFDGIILGGILGDDPPTGRTKVLKKLGVPERNLGPRQMSTDNAVFVAKQIIEGKKLSDITFQDGVELELEDGESVKFPFRYVLVYGKPFVSDALIEHLKHREDF
ncbi:hypothetical protein J4460_02920 [Candidatus Woesearchaeota archaeon]|nr:MAG: hypothetical protein QS99_C0006G0008 [archaeon GW2011_AR4]MBS3129599.1 hypothetical protein [Candidatus Woesearchaeota archaeon]HIH37692.1 hypothetical protein [Candidatus Woesearchaeota archaeon]HIH49058.1 hypothetical protein [Candidatus Woesearchaeota archaeon]HIJ02909.1 hypothetical protein [Candidatus Woesearchaeota archaeon]